MKTLEQILQKMGCKQPFKKDHTFTQKGLKTYNALENALIDVFELLDLPDIDDILLELWKIYKEEI